LYKESKPYGTFREFYSDGEIRVRGEYLDTAKGYYAAEYFKGVKPKKFQVILSDTVYYLKQFDEEMNITAVKFPILYSSRDNVHCITLDYTFFPKDDFYIKVQLGKFTNEKFQIERTLTGEIGQNQMCFKQDSISKLEGILYEMSAMDSSEQGFQRFNFSL
jgi:hypothetical protein